MARKLATAVLLVASACAGANDSRPVVKTLDDPTAPKETDAGGSTGATPTPTVAQTPDAPVLSRRRGAPAPIFTGAPGTWTGDPYPHGPEGPWWVRRASPDDPRDTCGTAESNLRRAQRAITTQPAPTGVAAPRADWDKKTAPARLDLIEKRFYLTASERERVFASGFAVPARLSEGTYSNAFHEIYQSQLPIYVSIDAVLHAVFKSNDTLIADIEEQRLVPLVRRLLAAMHAELRAAAASYPDDVAKDLDLYVTVARSLLAGGEIPGALGRSARVGEILARVRAAEGLETVSLFGRNRIVDFSQYTPRGHYANRPQLSPFFRAAMWLSRLELNLVSRSSRSSDPGVDPRETPREVTLALALSDLVTRARVDKDVALLDETWGVLAGRREDVSVADIARMRERAGIGALTDPSAPDLLRSAIGDGFQRTVRTHYAYQGVQTLPAIATLLGPRIVPDSHAPMLVVHDAISGRHMLSASDMGYALGHDRALAHLSKELASYGGLREGLEKARAELDLPLPTTNLYGAWLSGIRALSEKPPGVVPAFMETVAFQDMRLNSAIAAYGQLRHNYVLIAAQTYGSAGCVIPDGWVEPAPAVYDALIAYAERGASSMKQLKLPLEARYFERLKINLGVLRAITVKELANVPLDEEDKRFLSMVVEKTEATTGGPPTRTGWYFDMFRTLDDAQDGAGFIADYYTSSDSGAVAYMGATDPRLGIFVVDTGGPPRAFVGPVARAYELHAKPPRLSDASARGLTVVEEPWARSYTVDGPPAPPLQFRVSYGGGTAQLYIRSTRALGAATVEFLGHHREVTGSKAIVITGRGQEVTIPIQAAYPEGIRTSAIEAVRIRIGEWLAIVPGIAGAFGGMFVPG